MNDYPEWLVKAGERISRSPTSDLESRQIGVTRLCAPAWQTNLLLKHQDELPAQSPGEQIPAMLGIAWHKWTEQFERVDALVERPFSARFQVDDTDWEVRGVIDVYRPETQQLVDKKTAKTWSFVFGNRRWEEQLNVYRLLLELAGYRVRSLATEVVYLDWHKSGARRNESYPPEQFMTHEVDMWDLEDAQNFVFSRLRRLMDPRVCSSEERWCRDEHWAVMRTGRKTALKRCDSENDAKLWMEENGGTHIEHRAGTPTRCLDWCPVKEFCSYGKQL